MTALPSDPSPDVNITSEFKPNIKVAEFGDGYSQRIPYGINNTALEMELTWTRLDTTEKDTIMDFITDHDGGEAFEYTLPDEATERKFYFVDWSKTYVKYGVFNIRAKIKEVFDI